MKKVSLWLLPLVMFFVLSSCSSGPELVQWSYQKNAITLDIKADPKLNIRGNKGHKLSLCIYQLRDPSMLNQLTGNDQGLYKLLECTNFDSSSLACSRIFVDPGKIDKKMLDRAEGAKYVAVVAGYYNVSKDKIVRLYEIPQATVRYGFLKMKKKQVPGELKVSLNLGAREILSK